MKNDETFHNQQIRDMEVVLNRIRNIETDIYYLKNHPDYAAEWRCHVTHLTTLHGERITVEWKNDGTTN